MSTPPFQQLPPRGGPYSLSRTTPTGLVFVAGQTAVAPATGKLVVGGISEQTRQVLDNLSAILAAEGCDLSDVVKVSVFLADLRDFAAMNEMYGSVFRVPYPVRTTVQAVLSQGALIEIDAIACRSH
jgi:2-iminobutanoate/2-iminopropanoate deaminase